MESLSRHRQKKTVMVFLMANLMGFTIAMETTPWACVRKFPG